MGKDKRENKTKKKRCYRLFDNLIPSILDHLALDFNEPVALPHA
jgi:hypothetical protein